MDLGTTEDIMVEMDSAALTAAREDLNLPDPATTEDTMAAIMAGMMAATMDLMARMGAMEEAMSLQ